MTRPIPKHLLPLSAVLGAEVDVVTLEKLHAISKGDVLCFDTSSHIYKALCYFCGQRCDEKPQSIVAFLCFASSGPPIIYGRAYEFALKYCLR